MERNVDKIKRLEHELGRYKKKVSDQDVVLRKLHNELMDAHKGNQETQAAVDAVLTAVVLGHGVVAEDPDEPGKVLGWRLAVQHFTVNEMREKYEIRTRRDEESDSYVLGVVPRQTDDPA